MAEDLKKMYRTIMDDHFPPKMEISFVDTEKRQTLFYEKVVWVVDDIEKGLRYGENPGQEAALYKLINGNLVLGETETLQPGQYLVTPQATIATRIVSPSTNRYRRFALRRKLLLQRRKLLPHLLRQDRFLLKGFLVHANELVFHTQDSSTALAPEIVEDRGVFDQLRLGIPRGVTLALAPILGLAYLAALALAAALVLRRGARARDLLPAGLLVATQSLWYVIPGYAVAMGRPFANDLPFQWVCISTTHGLQYLWVTSYYARRSNPGVRTPAPSGSALNRTEKSRSVSTQSGRNRWALSLEALICSH